MPRRPMELILCRLRLRISRFLARQIAGYKFDELSGEIIAVQTYVRSHIIRFASFVLTRFSRRDWLHAPRRRTMERRRWDKCWWRRCQTDVDIYTTALMHRSQSCNHICSSSLVPFTIVVCLAYDYSSFAQSFDKRQSDPRKAIIS